MCTSLHAPERCLIPPSPELRERIRTQVAAIRESSHHLAPLLKFSEPRLPGLNDGVIVPGDRFEPGTPFEKVRSVAAERAPLRGTVRVFVALADFADRPMDPAHTQKHFETLFFGGTKSVAEYFREVSGGLVDVQGKVAGPYRMPHTLAWYANNQSGVGNAEPNARTLANDMAEAVRNTIDFTPYDNDGNGYVDAFIVIHSGQGAEVTGGKGDIWSHKWLLPKEMSVQGARVYAYLTVPEDARIGVCCHELGHLLFGWPDLYDTDYSSEGLGNWCLMAGGSWNGGGDVPAHPSAWCKVQQGWVNEVVPGQNGPLTIADVTTGSRDVYRLWTADAVGDEYFLVEHRGQTGYDAGLPGAGLLIYHVDDAVAGNENDAHPRVALLQADGRDDLGHSGNRGDAGDAYPAGGKAVFNATSTPGSKAYNGAQTGVALTNIRHVGNAIACDAAVRRAKAQHARGRRPRQAAPHGTGGGNACEALIRCLAGDTGGGSADNGWKAAVERRLGRLETWSHITE